MIILKEYEIYLFYIRILGDYMSWLYDNWMKSTPFLAFYSFILVFLFVRDVNYPLYLICIQGIVYWVHEFEEYIFPGGFSKFFNKYMMKSDEEFYPFTKASSFWINVPLVYIAMPFSALLSQFFGIQFGLWTAIFSFLNAFSHVVMFLKFGRKYNPGLVVSVLLNIPIAIYTLWFFLSNHLVSDSIIIVSVVVGILAQLSMMIYGFGYLVPKMKKEKNMN